MGETAQKQPTIVIECPKCEVIRIYQEVSPEYLKELIAVFTEKE